MFVFSVFLWVSDTEEYIQKKAFQKMHYAIQNATHDAALQVNKGLLTDGKVDFIESKANEAFKNTIAENVPFDNSLKSKSNLFYSENLTIVLEKYIDNNFIDPVTRSPVKFPYTFSHTTLEGKKYERILFGPSVVMIVKTKINGYDTPNEFLSISEYKGYK